MRKMSEAAKKGIKRFAPKNSVRSPHPTAIQTINGYWNQFDWSPEFRTMLPSSELYRSTNSIKNRTITATERDTAIDAGIFFLPIFCMILFAERYLDVRPNSRINLYNYRKFATLKSRFRLSALCKLALNPRKAEN